MAGLIGGPMRCSYSGSKFGVSGYFEALRSEFANKGIKITTVYPGYVKTKISENAIGKGGKKFGVTDPMIDKGMDPKKFAEKMVMGIYEQKSEILICDMKLKLALFLKAWLPGVFVWAMNRQGKSYAKKFKDLTNERIG